MAKKTRKSSDASTEAGSNGAADGAEETALTPAAATSIAPEVLDEMVDAIFDLGRSKTIDLIIGIGKLVHDRFYGADWERWHSRSPKETSIRDLSAKLVEAGLKEMKTAYLYRAVGIYELDTNLGGVSNWKQLAPSHFRMVLGLGTDQQRKLLTQAEEEGWGVERLETEVKASREPTKDGRGRPTLPRYIKDVNKLERLLRMEGAFGGTETLEHLDSADAQRLHQTVTDMAEKCREIAALLVSRVRG